MTIAERQAAARQMMQTIDLPEPFIRENDQIFIKFDRIDVELHGASAVLVWYWKGKKTVSQPVDGLLVRSEDVITIGPVEGKTEVTFTE